MSSKQKRNHQRKKLETKTLQNMGKTINKNDSDKCFILVNTLNVNELYSSIKSHRIAE